MQATEKVKMSKDAPDTTGHPCEDESCTDSVWRVVNEIDFVGQRQTANISFYGQVIFAVSIDFPI